MASQLYKALSQDMQDIAAKKGKGALQAFNRANDFYNEGINKINTSLAKYVKEGVDPSIVFNQLKAGTKVGDFKASRILSAVPKEDRGIIRNATLQQMGYDNANKFTVGRFLRDYGSLSPEGKNILFGKQGVGYRKSLDSLKDVARTFQESQALLNTSRTADNLTNVGLVGLGAFSLPAAVGTGVSVNVASRLLTNEGFVKTLAQAAKQPIERGSIRTFLKRLEQVAIKNPEIKDDIARYIGVVGSIMAQSMEDSK